MTMVIEYFHASVFGNGVKVAEEFRRQAGGIGVSVHVHHIRDVDPARLPTADLYVFSSPGRRGKPIKDVRRFLGSVTLPPGSRYGLLTTEMAPKPDKKTGQVPSDESKWQRVRPILNEMLQGKGLVEVAEGSVHVTGIKGPLEEGWQEKVARFVEALSLTAAA